MNCIFNKLTKKFTGAAVRWDVPETTNDEVVIKLDAMPDNTIRLNDTNDGVRPTTADELTADAEPQRIQDIKTEAGKRILALDASWTPENHAEKQRNDLMQATEVLLNGIKALRAGDNVAADAAIADGEAALVKKVKIDDVRVMSNAAELNGDDIATFIASLDAAGY